MASVQSHFLVPFLSLKHPLHHLELCTGLPNKNCTTQKVRRYRNNNHSHPVAAMDDGGISRRRLVVVLIQTAFATISFPSFAAPIDAGVDFRMYSDELNKFNIMIPQDWEVGAGENTGFKSLTAFYPAQSSGSNVSVVITGLGADFTRLESFGKVDAFAENLVSGLDRSWQRPPGVAAKLIDSKSANGLYYIEYTLQNPGESRRHMYSVLGVANNGWYNRLYTVTGQFVDEDSDKYGSQIEKAVASFRLV